MWKENRYRANLYLEQYCDDYIIRTYSHFYHIGSTEDLRNPIEEALVIKPGYAVEIENQDLLVPKHQMAMTFG